MYLKRLRLRGFKSFPRQTELVFEPGVGVVIGPNGSGKSNLADAVVWALGEQSASSLRGSSMQDVIFAGSDGRRAAAQAEVELTFDNADGSLPLPTDEVGIMRRVARDGSSQYFINQSSCRLTDVVELMAGVGLGKELHSIIGQGRVESFLAGKPEDRRSQIEEAAGLGTYKRRRERAELKLREVRRNLERAELLEREVGAQLGPLRRQATAAEQLRAAESELAEVRGRLLAGELAAADAGLRAGRAELAELEAEKARCDEALQGLADERAGEEERFARRLAERERRARRLLRVRVLDGRLEAAERLAAQRLRLLEELERSGGAERERLLAELAGAPEPEGAGTESAPAEARLAAELEAAEASHAEVVGRLEGARAAVAERRAEATRLAVEREGDLARAARLQRRREALTAEEQRLRRQLEALQAEAAERRASEAAAAGGERSVRAALEESGTRARTAAAEALAAGKACEEREEAFNAAAAERRALEAQLVHADAAMRELEEVGDEILGVAAEYPGTVALTGVVACEAGYERALGAALAQLSGALAVPSAVDHWSLLGALKRAGVGLVRLVVPPGRKRPATAFPGAAPLLDKITLGDRPELADALADVVIVDDLRAVPDEFQGLAVTREGEFYRPAAGQLGLAGGLPAAALLERRAALAGLRDRLDAVRSREVREEAALAKARASRDVAGEARRAAEQAERETRIAAEAAERDLATVRARLRDIDETLARTARSVESMAAEAAEADAEREAAEKAAAGALLAGERLREGLAASEDAAAAAEEAFAVSLGTVTRLRVELEERRAARQRAADERLRAERRAHEARDRLGELDLRLATLPGVRGACDALLMRLTRARAAAAGMAEKLTGEDDGEAVPDRSALAALADREAALRLQREAGAERRGEAQVTIARLDDRRAELAAELGQIGEALERAAFTPPESEADEAALRDRLERLSRRRDRIGPVNPLAEAECAELSERASFLREQGRDLERSIGDLESLIVELTAQIDAEFAGTFAAVQEQFAHMVEVLFPGGRGALKLVEPGAEGEAGGVAVEVKPARKLGKRLQLLSGGERALVAIAFLMALVLARPCPFYILDEIEAALDDVNIGRLVKLLRDYRERTQFIIVTHQKRTMEAADVLYGVTMGPDGASQVVSARMAEEEIEREERAKQAK